MTNEAKGGHEGGVGAAPAKPEHKSYSIHVDNKLFKVGQATITGAELRALPQPPIGPDRELIQVVPGGLDIVINDGDVIELREGEHFVSTPRNVTPGAADGR